TESAPTENESSGVSIPPLPTKNHASSNATMQEEPITPKVAVKPAFTPGADEAAQLAANLRERLAAVKESEGQVAGRQKQFDLIFKDIRGERAAIDELRKQVNEELKAVEAQLGKLEQRFVELEQQ